MTSKPTKTLPKANFLAQLHQGLAPSEELASATADAGLQLCDSRRRDHIPGRVTNTYGHDKSKTVEYRFNSCGYRSEEYRRTAKVNICVIGESHAVGTGVAFEKTFGFRLKAMLAKVLDLDLNDVNLINLAYGGASADYCARTLLRQLPNLPMDFVICIVPAADRIEYRTGKIFNSLVIGSLEATELEKLPTDLFGYCEYYSAAVGKLNRVKNMLVMESFLRSRDIEFVMAVERMPDPGEGLDALDPFLAQLDQDRLLRHTFFMTKYDRAADDNHAGPRSNGAFAIQVFHHLGGLLRLRGLTDLADKVAREARRLMAEDEDWAFCTKAS